MPGEQIDFDGFRGSVTLGRPMPPPDGIVGRSAPHDRRFNRGKASFEGVLGDDEELPLGYVTFPYVVAAFRTLPFTGILLPLAPSHDFASSAPTAASAFDQRSAGW